MALTDPRTDERTEALRVSDEIRVKFGDVLDVADGALAEIRLKVGDVGRANIATALGGDGASLLSVYDALKTAVETGKGVTLAELP